MPINATGFKYEPKQLGSFTMVKLRKTSADMSKINDSVTIGASKGRGACAGRFPVAPRNLSQQKERPNRCRINLLPEGRAPMREGVPLFASADADTAIGVITSGGFGPSLNRPVAMGYVPADMAAVDTQVFGEIRGKRLPLTVVKLPFIPANFKR